MDIQTQTIEIGPMNTVVLLRMTAMYIRTVDDAAATIFKEIWRQIDPDLKLIITHPSWNQMIWDRLPAEMADKLREDAKG